MYMIIIMSVYLYTIFNILYIYNIHAANNIVYVFIYNMYNMQI